MNKAVYLLFALLCGCCSGIGQIVINNQAACAGAGVSVQPVSVTCITNTTTNFTLTATGTAPLAYQWQTNSVNLSDVAGYSGATTASLWVSNVVIAQSNWSFRCVVTNVCGATTSSVATLTVTNGAGGGGGAFSPTNITGYPSMMWYVADNVTSSDFVTNWPDAGGSAWTLTIGDGAYGYPEIKTLGSHKAVYFPATNSTIRSFRNENLACGTKPWEIVMLIVRTNSIGGNDTLWCNLAETVYFQDRPASPLYVLSSGSIMTTALTITNKWYVLDVVVGNTSGDCVIYTNGVLCKQGTGSTSQNTLSGFSLGATWAGSLPSRMVVAEIVGYSTNLDATGRSALYNYFKTNYPSSSLP